jgi:hypothetical protein
MERIQYVLESLLNLFVNVDILVGTKFRRVWYIGRIELVALKEIGLIRITLRLRLLLC